MSVLIGELEVPNLENLEETEIIKFYATTYDNPPNLAVVVRDKIGQPYATLSVNADSGTMRNLGKGEFILTHNIENLASGKIQDVIINCDLFEITDKTADYGFVKSRPILRIADLSILG